MDSGEYEDSGGQRLGGLGNNTCHDAYLGLVSPVRVSLGSVLVHGGESGAKGVDDEFSDSDEVLANISSWTKEKYVDSSLSGVESEFPAISSLVYQSPYVDSPVSSVEHEFVVCQGDDEYKILAYKHMNILRMEAGLVTASSGMDVSGLGRKTPGSSLQKRGRFIYVQGGSSSSYGGDMSKQSCGEVRASVPVSGYVNTSSSTSCGGVSVPVSDDSVYVHTSSSSSYGYCMSNQPSTESCASVLLSADSVLHGEVSGIQCALDEIFQRVEDCAVQLESDVNMSNVGAV